MNDHHEDSKFLSASAHRLRLLEYLQANPRSPCEITEALALSRRGVQRNLSALTDRGWVERADGSYRLTTTGGLIAAQYAGFLEALETIETDEQFFFHLPDCAHAPDPRWLTDAEVVTADSSRPHAPIGHYMNSLRGCSTKTIRRMTPVLSQFHTAIHAELLDRGVETELVLARTASDAARSEYRAEFEAMVHSAACDLYVHEGAIGVGLTLTDRRGLVGAYDDHGRLCGCATSTHPALLEWAERLYERYRKRSCLLTSDAVRSENTTP